MSQRDLARAIGLTPGAVGQWEMKGTKKSKKTTPSGDRLEKVVAALGLTMTTFYARAPKIRKAS